MRGDSPTINMIAELSIKPGMASQFEAAFVATRSTYVADPGCLRFDLQRVKGRPNDYVVIESYTSEEALQRHDEIKSSNGFALALQKLVVTRPVVTTLAPIGRQAT